jgi:uncharacterized protein with GYD domain
MKYVLLGTLSPEWVGRQSERVGKAKAKLDKLGIKVESIEYTQGCYDFVDIVDAPNAEAMLAFACRLSTQKASKPRPETQQQRDRRPAARSAH